MRSVLFALPAVAALALAEPPRFSPEKRVALTTSRVEGWPDAPPPYRTRRALEKFAFKQPVHAASDAVHDLLFVVEQMGRIVHVPPSGMGTLGVFLELKDAETYGMTFHPKYATNKLVYIFSNGPNSAKKKKNQILRFAVTGDPPRCDPASRQVIIEWESNGHNGGDLAFGRDGMLYITSGDGTSDSDTDNTGQDLRDLCSGMLRIDVDRPEAGKGYSVPPDNPFLNMKNARPELWAFGFRNPWRMTFDPTTGDCLVGDVGQDLWEMVRLVTKGSNHGWSVTEGSAPFYPNRTRGPGPIVPPLIEHPHSESRSLTGGVVYQGKKLPDLRGIYVYGDYSTGKVWGLMHKDGKVTWRKDLAQTRLQIIGFASDRDGELYVVDHGGQIHQFEPSPPPGPSSFPRTLSESGLYNSVKENRLLPGLIPYTVNSPLWSDGADKERALGLPGMETIGFSENGAWTFPEKSVIVKTFSLDLAGGARKRVETRFLTLQQGEWYGYSYRWDDDQGEARLVEAGGATKPLTLRDGSALAWRYPSRVECMVCHTRAANYVLGLTTDQMNRDFDYGGGKVNQLSMLERLGVLRVPASRRFEAFEYDAKMLGRAGAMLTRCPPSLTKSIQKRYEAAVAPIRRGIDKKPALANRLPRPTELLPRLANPADESAALGDRARSYLHANCAHCHVWAGGGNSAINLHINEPLGKMKLVGEVPLHDKFGIADALLVAPGDPDRSVLLHRLKQRGKGQMPPLASARIDDAAVRLLRDWIRGNP